MGGTRASYWDRVRPARPERGAERSGAQREKPLEESKTHLQHFPQNRGCVGGIDLPRNLNLREASRAALHFVPLRARGGRDARAPSKGRPRSQ